MHCGEITSLDSVTRNPIPVGCILPCFEWSEWSVHL